MSDSWISLSSAICVMDIAPGGRKYFEQEHLLGYFNFVILKIEFETSRSHITILINA